MPRPLQCGVQETPSGSPPGRFPFVPATGRINRFFVFLGAADFYSLRRGAALSRGQYLAKIIYISATNAASDHGNSGL